MVTLTSIFFLFLLNNNGYFDFEQFGNNIKGENLSVIYLGGQKSKKPTMKMTETMECTVRKGTQLLATINGQNESNGTTT